MNRAVIGVGSNIDPFSNIKCAAKLITGPAKLLSQSLLVQTKPIGPQNQPDFTNCAFLLETGLDQSELKVFLKNIEDKLGRLRSGDKFGPRTIDLDIVVWNGEVIDQNFYERDFLRESVLKLLPDLKEKV